MSEIPNTAGEIYEFPAEGITSLEDVLRVAKFASQLQFPNIDFPNEGINVICSRGEARSSMGWMKLAAQTALDAATMLRDDDGKRPNVTKLIINTVIKTLGEFCEKAKPFTTFCGNQMIIFELSLTTLQRLHVNDVVKGMSKSLVWAKELSKSLN